MTNYPNTIQATTPTLTYTPGQPGVPVGNAVLTNQIQLATFVEPDITTLAQNVSRFITNGGHTLAHLWFEVTAATSPSLAPVFYAIVQYI